MVLIPATGSRGDPGFDTPLATLGVIISGDANTSRLQVIAGEPGETLPIGGNYLAVNTSNGVFGTPTVVTVNFQENGSTWFARGDTITLDLWDTESSPSPRVTVLVYDDLGTQVETVGFTPVSGGIGSVAVTYTGLVSRLEIVDSGGDGHIVDNLGFALENTAAPEPGSVVLAGTGLLLAGFLGRRRR